MNRIKKLISIISLLALSVLLFPTSALAFDGRSGDRVVVAADEVLDDDLYVTAREFVLDGTVNGDVIAAGQTVTINGKVEGDLIAAAQTIVVNGAVSGAIRIAGSALQVAEGASVGGDILGAGFSLEVQQGASVGQDIVYAGSQLLLAGDVARNVQAATGAFELRGAVGGNVQAEVGESGAGMSGPPPGLFMPQVSIPIPTVPTGITIDPSAKIEGNLEYTQSRELSFPAGVVAGQVIRNEPTVRGRQARQETTVERVSRWAFDVVRNSVTLILLGLLLLWLVPFFVQSLATKLESAFLPSLGWGLVAYAGFFFLLLLIVVSTLMGALLFGVLTLGGLAGTIIWLGLLSLFALIFAFVLVTSYIAKIVFGQALGRWLLARVNSPLAEHRFWPMIIGVVLTVAVIALFSFPLIPGFLGWLLNIAIVLSGLGALWLWGRERTARQPVTAS